MMCSAQSTVGAASSRVQARAPSDPDVVEYDRRYLSLYAALLDAADVGQDWQEAATAILGLDVSATDAEACWRSHLDRARWIVGEGLPAAVTAFGRGTGSPSS